MGCLLLFPLPHSSLFLFHFLCFHSPLVVSHPASSPRVSHFSTHSPTPPLPHTPLYRSTYTRTLVQGPEIQITLSVLKQAKRFLATVSFEQDTQIGFAQTRLKEYVSLTCKID